MRYAGSARTHKSHSYIACRSSQEIHLGVGLCGNYSTKQYKNPASHRVTMNKLRLSFGAVVTYCAYPQEEYLFEGDYNYSVFSE